MYTTGTIKRRLRKWQSVDTARLQNHAIFETHAGDFALLVSEHFSGYVHTIYATTGKASGYTKQQVTATETGGVVGSATVSAMSWL